MKAFFSDRLAMPLPPGHRFPMPKYRMLRDRLASMAGIELVEASPAGDHDLVLAHEPDYVARVVEGRLGAGECREIGFPWSPELVERSRRSVGATLAAAQAALSDGVSAQLAGGTHHAYAGKGSGFCVFNDVAVAARRVQADAIRAGRRRPRLFVVDLDVHQGNGTASIFEGDASVFTLSLHGEKNFPFRKERSCLDVGLPDGCADAAYLAALDAALAVAESRFAGVLPDLAFYIAGADPHEDDRLGRLKLGIEGLAERDRRVLAWLGVRRVPVAIAMGGGYGRQLETTLAVQIRTFLAAVSAWREWHGGTAGNASRTPMEQSAR